MSDHLHVQYLFILFFLDFYLLFFLISRPTNFATSSWHPIPHGNFPFNEVEHTVYWTEKVSFSCVITTYDDEYNTFSFIVVYRNYLERGLQKIVDLNGDLDM